MRRVHTFGLIVGLALGLVACEGGDDPLGGDGGDTDMAGDGDDGGDGDGGADGDSGGSGGADGGGPVSDADLDAVEAACEADCEALLGTECAPGNQNVLTCKLSCASVTVQLGNFCLDEYTATVECRAEGGYDCVMGYPYPRSTCVLENSAFSECSTDLGCKRYCDDAVAAGCGGESFAGCLDECLADKAAAPGYCGVYLDSWRLCDAQFGITCGEQGPVATPECIHGLGNYADCIADELDDPCAGLCLVADELACGSGCSSECASQVADPDCGQQFASLVDCQLRHGDYECSDGRLAAVGICDYEQSNYDECLAGTG